MSLLPFENQLLRTNLPFEEVSRRLDEVIGAPRGINPLAGRSEPYLGTFDRGRFKITRQSSYRNPSRPVIIGEIVAVGSGSYVHLIMRPPISSLIFMGIWFVGVAVALVDILVSALLGEVRVLQLVAESVPLLFVPVIFFIFGYALVVGGFKLESTKSKGFFVDLIEPYRIEGLGIPSAREAA